MTRDEYSLDATISNVEAECLAHLSENIKSSVYVFSLSLDDDVGVIHKLAMRDLVMRLTNVNSFDASLVSGLSK